MEPVEDYVYGSEGSALRGPAGRLRRFPHLSHRLCVFICTGTVFFFVRLYCFGLGCHANSVEEYVLLSALLHIFAGLKRTRDQELSSGLMSCICRGTCPVECVAAHLRGFEEDSRSEVVFWIVLPFFKLKTSGLAGFALDSNMTAICSNTFVYVRVTIFALCWSAC